MLEYRKGFLGLPLLLRLNGSTLPRALVPAAAVTVASSLVAEFARDEIQADVSTGEDGLFLHPYPFQIYVFLLGFMLVFRANNAYQRFWEARSNVQLMTSKWTDAALLAFLFSQGQEEEKISFRGQLIHALSLLHAVSLQKLRNDSSLGNIETQSEGCEVEHRDGRWREILPNAGEMLGFSYYSRRREARAAAQVKMPVIGGLSEKETTILEGTGERAHSVLHHVEDLLERQRRGGGLSNSPPIDTRLYHVLSDGMSGYMLARRVSDTPFPFPTAQLTVALLVIFSVIMPILMPAYVNETWLVALLSFFTTLAYWALHEASREIEEPFRYFPNGLPLRLMQLEFNERLLTLCLQSSCSSVNAEKESSSEWGKFDVSSAEAIRTEMSNLRPCKNTEQRFVTLNKTVRSVKEVE